MKPWNMQLTKEKYACKCLKSGPSADSWTTTSQSQGDEAN